MEANAVASIFFKVKLRKQGNRCDQNVEKRVTSPYQFNHIF